ncbi:hypothetical protein ScPMuIL_013635 [Solemya velum]
MISEIFILPGHNTALVSKRFRCDTDKEAKKIFVQKIKSRDPQHSQPHFKENGHYFYYVKRNGLFFVAVSKNEISPVFVIEFLSRFYYICKDFCGVVSEDSIQANVLLIYELLDEILDCGYIQLATTEKLRPYIQSEPVLVSEKSPAEDIASRLFGIETRVAPGSAANKPVVCSNTDLESRKHEIFVDVIEKITAVINADGTLSRMEVNGSVNMKNFLMGSPQIKMAFNEDLTLSKKGADKGYGNHVHLDKYSFHQCVKQEGFEKSRILTVVPPVGEFSVLTYSVGGDMSVTLPFRLTSALEDLDRSRDMMVTLRLRAEIPTSTQAVNVTVSCPVPGNVSSMSQHLTGPGQTAIFLSENKHIVWKIKNLPGKTEAVGQFRLINQTGGKMNKQEVGPVAMEFEVSGYTNTGLQIRYMRVYDRENSYVPFRWVRYITISDSYIVKIL